MSVQRKSYNAKLKARIALEAIRGDKTMAELSSQYSVHANQIGKWRKQAVDGLSELFSRKRVKKDAEHQELLAQLYEQVGRLQFELDWLKKKSGLIA